MAQKTILLQHWRLQFKSLRNLTSRGLKRKGSEMTYCEQLHLKNETSEEHDVSTMTEVLVLHMGFTKYYYLHYNYYINYI